MRLRAPSLLLLAFIVASGVSGGLRSQTTTSGGLMGVVTDPSNLVVPDATVELSDDAKGTVQSTKTDRTGTYQFFFLGPGKYSLTFRNSDRVFLRLQYDRGRSALPGCPGCPIQRGSDKSK
jgi:hypothetical protein